MPRYKLKDFEPQPTKSPFDLTTNFTSYVTDKVYSTSDSLIFWGRAPATATSPYLIGESTKNKAYEVRTSTSLTLPTIGNMLASDGFCGDANSFVFRGVYGLDLNDDDDYSFGDGSSDSNGFAISLWLRSASPHDTMQYFTKYAEYQAGVDGATGRIFFTIADLSAGATKTIFSSVNPLTSNLWQNLTFLYDGTGTHAGMDILLNGNSIKASTGTAGSYTAMENTSFDLMFGAYYVPASTTLSKLFIGEMAEIAIWNKNIGAQSAVGAYKGKIECVKEFKNEYLSGYISLPPRVRIRQYDSATGSYPTVLRTGDRFRRGSYKVNFNDTNTIIFGERVTDNFNYDKYFQKEPFPRGSSANNIPEFRKNISTKINQKKWKFSLGSTIRREVIRDDGGFTRFNGAFVFSGTGEAGTRYIQTKTKIRNPIIRVTVINGPYNVTSNQFPDGLNLKASYGKELLKFQYSTDGNTWKTAKTLTPTPGPSWAPVEIATKHINRVGDNRFASIDVTAPDLSVPLNKSFYQARGKVVLNFKNFSAPNETFYFRVAQTTIVNPYESVWAISDIDIMSMNQKMRYPTLIDHTSSAGIIIDNNIIATPHTKSNITATGRQVSGISDVNMRFTPGEATGPFDDTVLIEDLTKDFYKFGVDPAIYPGFSSKLRDKTKFTLNLTPSTQTTFGYTENGNAADPVNDTSGVKQQLMVYWNDSSKRWERIAQGVSSNNISVPSTGALGSMIQLAAVGFSSVGNAATASINPLKFNVLHADVMSTYVRPTKVFGFPSHGKFHATGSQLIDASSMISHPFLLEKIILEFKGKFEFADGAQHAGKAFALEYVNKDGASPARGLSNAQASVIPTFFMLRQAKESLGVGIDTTIPRNPKIYYAHANSNIFTTGSYDLTIPTASVCLGTTSQTTSIFTNRELITYSQLNLYTSGTAGTRFDTRDALANGLGRDSNVNMGDITNQSITSATQTLKSFTSSFMIESPVRMTPATARPDFENTNGEPYKGIGTHGTIVNTGQATNLYLGDPIGGRSVDKMRGTSRTIVNSYPTFTPGKTNKIMGEATDITHDVYPPNARSVDRISPYILFPEDKLILGWQYPLINDLYQRSPSSGETLHNSLTLSGSAKLHLYGSLIKNNKEYHQTCNQNLTSNAIHEFIGAEPIVDQYQINPRNEYSGSYADLYPSSGKTIWITITSPFFFTFPVFVPTLTPVNAIDRIGAPNLSVVNPVGGAALKNAVSFNRFSSAGDEERKYLDSIRKNGFFKVFGGFSGDLTSYGTMQTGGGKKSPRYYFNLNHFGHYSDNIKQGSDSAMIIHEAAYQNPVIVELAKLKGLDPAIKVKFVENITITNDQGEPREIAIYNDPGEWCESFNLSIFSTSSIAYVDNALPGTVI